MSRSRGARAIVEVVHSFAGEPTRAQAGVRRWAELLAEREIAPRISDRSGNFVKRLSRK
jgi:hypothetical protein